MALENLDSPLEYDMPPLRRPGGRTARRPGLVAVLAALSLALTATPSLAAGSVSTGASAAATVTGDDSITFTGHGWGHGRGMGQWGALGYAVDYGKSYSWILDHFYGGTTAGDVGDPEMTVELLGLTGKPLVVTGTHVYVHTTAPSAPLVDLGTAARFTVQPDGHVKVEKSSSCAPESTGGSWQVVSDDGTYMANATRVQAAAGATAVPELLRVCEASDQRAYRGELSVVSSAGVQMTINHLPTQSYLRGVVPRESPASWGDMGGGKGMEALKAQAVAARSYALSSTRASGAKTCDTTSCQVYRGAGVLGSSWDYLEDSRTDAAIAATAGEVRFAAGTTTIARTEFSSSTGGWTVGGTFPAVEDLGDAITANPNHVWTTSLTSAQVASRLGLPGVRVVVVASRNGLGDYGGRVLKVDVVDTNGATHTYTGAEFRSKMGTSTFKSDWFAIASVQLGQAQAVVKALYADLLGRGVDPSGLEWWSTRLMTGTSQSELVRFLTGSDEYIRKRVTAAYREVLGRGPDPAGMDFWYDAIVHGRATVDDVKRRFYDSQEYYQRAGGTDAGYVALLYRTMLDREGSSSEVAYWTSMIPTMGRSRVVDAIWFSMEAAVYRAGGYYQVFLKRSPDKGGQQYWGGVLLASGEGAVRMGIAGSDEYARLAVSRFP